MLLVKFFHLIERFLRAVLPSPFTIAVVLTLITFILALTITPYEGSTSERIWEVANYWNEGLWNPPLLVFAVQMMLMLVLGHVLALTKSVDFVIRGATRYCSSTAKSALIVTLLTVLVSLFNWGLGLIFGAILARKVGEHARAGNLKLNYPLIGAAGYSGLMVWHGGISGSAPIKVAEDGHLKGLMSSTLSEQELAELPQQIDFSSTVFGSMNLTAMVLVVIVLPAFMYLLGRRFNTWEGTLPAMEKKIENKDAVGSRGAERLDDSRIFSLIVALLVVTFAIMLGIRSIPTSGSAFITPDFINLMLLGLCLLLHKSFKEFLNGVDQAIGGSSGILIQFPIYFGIMGIMNHSGLIGIFSDAFVSISNATSFPVYAFFSAGIVNIFVPSGGGQWAVQGPIIIQAALELGASLPKAVMALAYGDQLTNMLQPFWALPLLGITGLKAKSILPYSVLLMLVGLVIFTSVLLLF